MVLMIVHYQRIANLEECKSIETLLIARDSLLKVGRKQTKFTNRKMGIELELDQRTKVQTWILLIIINYVIGQLHKQHECCRSLNSSFKIFRTLHDIIGYNCSRKNNLLYLVIKILINSVW